MSSTAHLDQDALNNLTPEERAAFADDEFTDDEKAAMAKLAAGAPDDDDDDDGADDGSPDEVLDANGKPVTVPASTEKAADVGSAAADADADAGGAPVAAATETPGIGAVVEDKPLVYKASLPEDFDAKVKELADKTAALRAQFKSGEIDFDEFDEQNSTLAQEREALTVARTKAEVSQEMTQQSAEQRWNSAIDRLYSTAAQTSGIDYRKDAERNAELDGFVKVLANNPANADKPMDWFLNEAHKRVLVLNGKVPTPTQTPTPDTAKPAQNRTPPPAPRTIAHLPGGDGPGDVGQSEFAHLDALDGDDLEAAIAKMSPAQREKYSRGA